MSHWKEITDSEIKEFAEKQRVNKSIIDELLFIWSQNLYYEEYYDSYDEDPSPKEVAMRTIDWANLSILFHNNKSALESDESKIFTRAIFTPLNIMSKSLKLSSYTSNQIIKTYFKKLSKNKELLSIDDAEQILKQYGGRPQHYANTFLYNAYIENALRLLKSKNIKNYAKIISDLLSLMGIAEVKPGTIRQHRKRFLSNH